MPEVIALYNKYYDKGLAVYGITNDLKQLPSARAFAEKKKINFPLLIGNEQVKKEYQLEAVPLYVLIDKKGIIRLIRPGYSAELEEMVLDILK
jgi:peroxiredoxin